MQPSVQLPHRAPLLPYSSHSASSPHRKSSVYGWWLAVLLLLSTLQLLTSAGVASAAAPPNPPASLGASAFSKTEVYLEMEANHDIEVDSLVLERAITNEGVYTVIATLNGNERAFVDENLLAGTSYTYRLKAVNAAGSSTYLSTQATTHPVVNVYNAQPQWNQRFGGSDQDWLTALIRTADGGYLLGGRSLSGASGDHSQPGQGDADYWVVKLDARGSKLWDKRYGGRGYDGLEELVATADGGYLLGGTSASGQEGDRSESSRGQGDYWLVKIDASGNKLWDHRYGGSNQDVLQSLIKTADGGYLLGGSSASGAEGDKRQPSQGGNDYWVVKVDAAGRKLWDKRFGGDGNDGLAALVENADGSYLLGGTSLSSISGDQTQEPLDYTDDGYDGDYWIVKISGTGTKQWDRRYGGEWPDILSALIKTSDGGYLLGGSGKARGPGNYDTCGEPMDFGYAIWIVRIDSSGEAKWDKAFFGAPFLGTVVNDYLNALIPTNDGGFLLGGASGTNRGNAKSESSWGGGAFNLCDHGGVNHSASVDYWIIKLDSDGSQRWDKDFGGYGTDALSALVQNADGSYVLAGYSDSGADGDKTHSSQGGNDYWIVKTNPGPPCPSVAFTPASGSALPTATAGVAYRQAITTDSSGYSFTAIGLPTGLSISAEGLITGTPRSATASPDTVTVTATKGTCLATATYMLTVEGNGEPLVVSFTLIDARTGQAIQPLKEGDVLNLLLLPNQLSVRANTDPAEVGSVVFGLNNKPSFRVENFAPYALASNNPDDSYVPYPFQTGEYILAATPYSQEKGQGEKGLALSIHFRVIRPRVTSFTLVNAATDDDIRTLKAGDVLDLSTLPAQLSVRANTDPEEVGSVVFDLNEQATFQADNFAPYALTGNDPDGTYLPYAFQAGEYALTATPYSQETGQGKKGTALSIHFRVVRSKVASFTLINTVTGEDIQPLKSGDVLDLATLPAQLSIRANLQPTQVGSVVFGLNDKPTLRMDNQVPYALTGNNPDGHYLFFGRIGEGKIGSSKAIAVDGSGNLYVSANSSILKFDSLGRFLLQFGSPGGGEGQFSDARDLALDSKGNLLVVDNGSHRIQRFDSSGHFLSKFGRYGRIGGRFDDPAGVAVDGSGKIYVADTRNNRIQKFFSTGGYLSQFGRYGSGEGQFWFPVGVAVDGSGNIYVTESVNRRVQKFSSSFNFLATIGSTGTGEGKFNNPAGVAVDGSGNLFVADTYYNGNGIQKYDSSGHFLTRIGSGNDVTVDGSGFVYVADGEGISKYSPSGSYLPYAFQVGQYALTATPYSQANGLGEKGLALKLHFQVVNSASTARTLAGEGAESLEVEAYPNPFGEQVYLVIRSLRSQSVEVQGYDATGVAVEKLYQGELQAGQAHRVEFNGRTWPDGLYFLRVSTPQQQLVRKVMRQRN